MTEERCPCHECHCDSGGCRSDLEGLARREASVPEPMPVRHPESRDVTAALLNFLDDYNYADAAKLIRQRREYGMAKYGTTLMSHNGRDVIEDIRQEAGDLLQYVAQSIIEGRGAEAMAAVEGVLHPLLLLLRSRGAKRLIAAMTAKEGA